MNINELAEVTAMKTMSHNSKILVVHVGAAKHAMPATLLFTAKGMSTYKGQHNYAEDLLELDRSRPKSGVPQWLIIESPFILKNWCSALQSHSDK